MGQTNAGPARMPKFSPLNWIQLKNVTPSSISLQKGLKVQVLDSVIGSGVASVVYKGEYERQIVAVKLFKSAATLESALQETDILKSLSHENVIK